MISMKLESIINYLCLYLVPMNVNCNWKAALLHALLYSDFFKKWKLEV